MSERRTVQSGGAFEPVYGYSRAVRVGPHIYVSGTCAPISALGGDAYAQAVAAFAIIADALAGLGASLDDVVRTTTFITDMGDAQKVARAHREALGHVMPAASLIGVSALLDPRMCVEIEATALTAS